jgi:hypothetical protein
MVDKDAEQPDIPASIGNVLGMSFIPAIIKPIPNFRRRNAIATRFEMHYDASRDAVHPPCLCRQPNTRHGTCVCSLHSPSKARFLKDMQEVERRGLQ